MIKGLVRYVAVKQIGKTFPLEVTGFGNAEMTAKGFTLLLAQKIFHLIRGEEIEFSLLPVTVGILRAVKTAFRVCHLPKNIGDGFLGDLQIQALFCHRVGLAVTHDQQRVIVQHFFKMGDQKLRVGGVAEKAEAQMVKQSSPVHLQESLLCHLQAGRVAMPLIISQEKQQVVRRGELGRPAESAVLWIIALPIHFHSSFCQIGDRHIACRAAPAQVSHDLIGLPQQRGPVIFPFFMDHTEQFPQSDHTACGVLRKIGGRKERLLVGCHEDTGRPTAAAGERLTDRHVDGVNIRSLLLVHLDGNKIPVQKFRDLLVLKALMGHDMTPVAGAVSDAEKDRLILLSGPAERLLSPGIPLHRILRMLEQIGA